MPKDYSKDILSPELDYMNIALISAKTKVLIIGGGRAGFIKTRSFVEHGCQVLVISKDFSEEFKTLEAFENLQCIVSEYKVDFIFQNHLIVIAVNLVDLLENIMKDCEIHCKLYLNCTNFKEGSFVIPAQGKTENINFSIHTQGGNPKTSMFLVKTMSKKLSEYDELVGFNHFLRERIKLSPNKNEILDFISSEDFKFFVKKRAANIILQLFYGGFNFEIKNCD